MKTLLVLCLSAWSTLALAQAPDSSRPPTEETAIVQTRDGYKARTPRHVSHERNVYKFDGHGWKFPVNQGSRVLDHIPLPADPAQWRREIACKSDAIAVVTVVSQRPVLSQGENFIFTEYRVEISDSIKGRLVVGQRTNITRIGGTIVLPGDRITFAVNSSPELVVGNKYLVFLRHLPETDDYTPVAPRTTYEVRPGGRLQMVHDGYKPQTRADSEETFAAAREHEPCGGR